MSRRSQRRLTQWLQVLSLAAAAWYVWFYSVVPRLAIAPISSIVGQALFYVTFAGLAAAAITAVTYLVVRKASVHGQIRDPLGSISVAVWYAPAMFVASGFSPISLGASLIMVISTTRVLVAKWTAPTARKRSRKFTPPRVLGWRTVIALVASAAVHASIFAIGGNYRLPAAALLALSAAVITALAIVIGAHTPRSATSLPNAVLGVILTLILALGITVLRSMGGDSDVPGDGSGPSSLANQKEAPKIDRRLPADGDFPGVILLAERPPDQHPEFVIPKPSQHKAGEPKSHTIPFTGEYWLFRRPFSRPPEETSFRAEGSLLDFSFSSTDGFPLLMEAHQRLEKPIDLGCCSGIEVAVISKDLIPGSAWLDLTVLDSRLGRVRLFPLGHAALSSGGREVLRFPVPARTLIERFDELKLAFHQASHTSRSLKVEVEGFTLVPRGL